MPHKKKISLIAILLIIIGFTGMLFTGKSADDMVTAEKEFRDEIRVLNIAIDNGKVIVLPSSDESIRLELEAIGPDDKMKATVSGNELSITVNDNQKKWYHFPSVNTTPELTIYVPEKELAEVMIDSDNGSIIAESIQSETVTVSTGNGYTELENVTGSTVDVESNNGKINLIDVVARATTVATDNGKIIFEHVDGNIVGYTSNGAITLDTADIDRNIDLKTSNGKIQVNSKNKPTNTIIDVQVGNGKARVFGESNWDTVIGDGDHLVKLTTSNGGITIE